MMFAATFAKSHKAPKIKQVPWTHLRALTKQPITAPSQTWSVKYKIGGTGPTLMAVLKNTKKGKT